MAKRLLFYFVNRISIVREIENSIIIIFEGYSFRHVMEQVFVLQRIGGRWNKSESGKRARVTYIFVSSVILIFIS